MFIWDLQLTILNIQDQYLRSIFYWLFRERDKDNDGKLNFQEFFSGLFYWIRHDDDEEGSTEYYNGSDAPAKKSFSQLDLDNDG
jgi:Ca2+-binding EF-hand superfamily protein